MHLNRIESQTVASNTESVRLLERSGFYLDGIRREFTLEEDGTYHGAAIYSLLRHEYFPESGQNSGNAHLALEYALANQQISIA